MIRTDDVDRTITLSVRDLVEIGAPSGHLSLQVVQSRGARAAAGRRVHTEWQTARAAEDEAYRAEVALKRQVAIDGWTCTVQGRVDGLQEEDGRTLVEEIKSTVLDAGRLYATTARDWPAFVLQLEVYLWMLAESGFQPPVGRLVLVSLADGARHVLGVGLDRARVTALVIARLTELVQARERRRIWLAGRRAATVPLPHPAGWRPGQREIAEATEWGLDSGTRVLVEAPTGLGKTAAALYGALRHALAHDKQVFWATARTTQQDGPVRTLDLLAAAGLPVRSVVISAKHKVCLNDVVSCRPDTCLYAESYYDKLRDDAVFAALAQPGHRDRDALMAAGRRHRVCPYELALDLSAEVDVVIGDYNYVFDPSVSLRRHFTETAGDWVVVTDEVHQLAERARGYYSPRVEASLARQAVSFLWSAGAAFAPFVFLAERIESQVLADVRGASGRSAGALRVAEPDVDAWQTLAEQVDGVGLDYALLKADQPPSWSLDDDAWLSIARQVLRFAAACDDRGDDTVALAGRAEGTEWVGHDCLDPSRRLGPRLRQLGGFVGLSATLSPARFHRDLLGLDPDALDVVQVPSPFPPARRRVWIAPRVSTAFADRAQHADGTAGLISRCVAAVPGNTALYFPSFAMLDDIVGRLSLPGREVLAQERGMDDAARAAFLERLGAGGTPVVLAAVLGGVYAEGIDLPPGALRAVIIAGPALPPVGLQRDLLRDYFQERYGAGHLYASLVPGMTRVVQAAGRLIRRPEDRGVVLLLGRRFRWRDIGALVPAAFEADVADDPVAAVSAFFSRPDTIT